MVEEGVGWCGGKVVQVVIGRGGGVGGMRRELGSRVNVESTTRRHGEMTRSGGW